MSGRRRSRQSNKSNRKTNSSPYAKKEAKVNGVSNTDEPPTDFKFLGFPNQEFNYKSNNPLGKSSEASTALTNAKQSKQNRLVGAAAEDDDMSEIRLPLFFPFSLGKQQNSGNDGSDDYCTEIVDQMRQNTNSLIDEIKESRKATKESTESANKQLIDAIKELQSELKKALTEELPKVINK